MNRNRQVLALPAALTGGGRVGFIRGCRRAGRSNCICGGPELVSSDVRHHRGLSRGKRRELRCTGNVTRRSIRSARDHFRVHHSHRAANPGVCRIDRLTGTVVVVANSLEVVQDMLGADGTPQSEKVMMGIRKRAATPNGDQTGIAVYGKDHEEHQEPQVSLRLVPDSRSATATTEPATRVPSRRTPRRAVRDTACGSPPDGDTLQSGREPVELERRRFLGSAQHQSFALGRVVDVDHRRLGS